MNKEAKELLRIERQIADTEQHAAFLEDEISQLDAVLAAEKTEELRQVERRLLHLNQRYQELEESLYEDYYEESW